MTTSTWTFPRLIFILQTREEPAGLPDVEVPTTGQADGLPGRVEAQDRRAAETPLWQDMLPNPDTGIRMEEASKA